MGTNQIDHVLINKKRLSTIKDARSMQGPNCDSDHFLVRVKYKQKKMKLQGDKYEKKKKWNQEKLEDPSSAKEYRKEIIRKMVHKGVSHQVE